MKKIFQYTLGICVAVSMALSIFAFLETPKIGVVDFKRLVNDFTGMKEATEEYDNKMKEWNHLNDSLSNEIKMALEDYYADSAYLSKEDLMNEERKILSMRKKYLEFTQGLENNAQLEDQKMTSEVVNQVLSFVNKYGDEHGFDLIVGRNEGNYVLYKSVENDITDELLKALNLNYEGY